MRRSRTFKCRYCDKEICGSVSNLRRHINAVHMKLKPYKCQFCGLCFTQATSVIKHVKNVHKNVHEINMHKDVHEINVHKNVHERNELVRKERENEGKLHRGGSGSGRLASEMVPPVGLVPPVWELDVKFTSSSNHGYDIEDVYPSD